MLKLQVCTSVYIGENKCCFRTLYWISWGNYHLLGKTGNSGWKIKWLATFCLGSFRIYGLCCNDVIFFYSF